MDDIPDEDAKELQELAVQYASATQDGDMNDGIQELTGINVDLVNKLQDDTISNYFTYQKKLDQMVHDMDEKIPDLLGQIKKVTGNSDTIFQKFVDAGYIDSGQKELVVRELTSIQSELEEVEDTISNWSAIRDQSAGDGGFGAILGADLGAYTSLNKHKTAILDSLNRLDDGDPQHFGLRRILNVIINGHSISNVLKVISGNDKSYQGVDMLLTGNGGAGDIQVNISAAMRMYNKGQSLLDDKKEEIKKLKSAVEREIPDCYQQVKKKVGKQINKMEANPKAYAFLLTKHNPTLDINNRLNREVKHIHVAEEYDALEHADMEEHIDELNDSVEKGEKYIESYRSSIEDLFDKEEKVAAMFDLAEEVLN